jgi:putative intracellular protease/amidase
LYEDPFSQPISDADEQAIRDKVQHTKKPSDVNAADYNVIYYVGGVSCLVDFPQTNEIGLLARNIYENGGIVAAVCDGISGLIPITLSDGKPLVDGKNLTTNIYGPDHGIDIAVELRNKGGLVDQQKGLVSDKRVITGQNVRPVQVAMEILKLLNIQFPMSVEGVAGAEVAIQFYPNPAVGTLNVALPAGATSASYRMYAVSGQLVKQGEVRTEGRIDISSVPGGQYIVETKANNGLVHKAVVAVKDR